MDLSLFFARTRRNGGRARRIAPLVIGIAAIGLAAAGLLHPAAEASPEDEVECSSLRLQVSAGDYDSTCEFYSSSSGAVEYLEANASDGSHFLVVLDRTAVHRYIYRSGGSLSAKLRDDFRLEISDWRSGDTQQGLKTAEFETRMKGIPSQCVAFEKYMRKEYGGYRRWISGFGCSQKGDRAQVYAAMRHVNFPE